MSYYQNFNIAARLFDMDTQRHVTSRTYEAFCWEGRIRMMKALGYPLDSMLEKNERLTPKMTHCSFSKEQLPGNELVVHTYMEPKADQQSWLQEVKQTDGALACRIATITAFEREGQIHAADFPAKGDGVDSSEISPSSIISELPSTIDARTNCDSVQTPVTAMYSERSPFFNYPSAAFWRLIEEGRWGFSHAIGLDHKRILELDTITFFTSGTFRIYQQPVAGEVLTVHTWVDRIEKIRCFLRNDVMDTGGNLIASNIEEQLIVSLSRRRPKRAGPEYIHLVEKYLSKRPE